MTARVLTIKERDRQSAGMLASLADFTLAEGEGVEPELALKSPDISLYCLDDESRRAIFVQLPPGVDLTKAPFVYRAQYEQAERLIAMPYETFSQLSRDLPDVRRLILIYVTGRSGSTLLSHMFNELDGVVSLSEPDVATQFVHLREPGGRRDAEARELLESTVRFLFKPIAGKQPSTCVLKFRSEAVGVMDLYQATSPEAKNLFSYRDVVGFAASFYRIFKQVGFPEYEPVAEWRDYFGQILNRDLSPLTAYLDGGAVEASLPQRLALWWLAVMEGYLAQCERGISALVVRYNDLNRHREEVVRAVFEYCGLPTSSVQAALRVFERDPQAGTFLGREDPSVGNQLRLTEAQVAEIRAILRQHPVINSLDFTPPGSLAV